MAGDYINIRRNSATIPQMKRPDDQPSSDIKGTARHDTVSTNQSTNPSGPTVDQLPHRVNILEKEDCTVLHFPTSSDQPKFVGRDQPTFWSQKGAWLKAKLIPLRDLGSSIGRSIESCISSIKRWPSAIKAWLSPKPQQTKSVDDFDRNTLVKFARGELGADHSLQFLQELGKKHLSSNTMRLLKSSDAYINMRNKCDAIYQTFEVRSQKEKSFLPDNSALDFMRAVAPFDQTVERNLKHINDDVSMKLDKIVEDTDKTHKEFFSTFAEETTSSPQPGPQENTRLDDFLDEIMQEDDAVKFLLDHRKEDPERFMESGILQSTAYLKIQTSLLDTLSSIVDQANQPQPPKSISIPKPTYDRLQEMAGIDKRLADELDFMKQYLGQKNVSLVHTDPGSGS